MQNKVATIGLVGFLAVDVALVALALRPSRPDDASPAATTPVTSFTTPGASGATGATGATKTPTTTASSGATGGSAAPTGPKPAPVTELVGALDATTAWRATTGTCGKGGSAMFVTTDGGKTWDKTESPARALIRVQPLTAARVFAIGAGSSCDLKQYASNDLGVTWQAGTAVSGGWARQLDEPTEVLTPQDDRAQPCGASTDVIDLSRTSADQAQALCADGSVMLTEDGGQRWTDDGTVKGGLALGNRLESNRLATYVARVGGDCPGIDLVRVVKGEKLESVACVGTKVPSEAGQVGVSVVSAGAWIVAGDAVYTGNANLTKWKQP
ncbi:WD40/YVTN/BNR-like repeat-containing protein [Humibacillus xanthopallidus]|uniref:BNR repeat protein n=1 Tax=Humibacillus xanthopallidus TaxID=412689 RepID=A0A543I085_9MICO|nr:hypothetical protein [Humibacillus xanthopallidus]TQM64008.1 hypothetical protein FBY41_0366 [Humibacillus xanthopallidus]